MADITIANQTGLSTISESNGTGTFTVKLANTQPTNDVKLNITSSDVNIATVDQTVLLFTNANWNTNQTVTVRGVPNNLVTGSRTVTITVSVDDANSDSAYDDVADKTFTATITDDDTAGITIVQSGGSTTVTEAGGTDSFTVVLNGQPTSPVELSVTSADIGEVIVDQPSLLFTPTNWNTPQTITVTGVNDDIDDGNVSTNITIAYLNGDSNFSTVSSTVAVTTNDDSDAAGFTLSKSTATVSEAQTSDTFTVVLDAKPTGNVAFVVAAADTTEVSVSTAALTFTTANWDTPQTVTVTGVVDNIVDNNINSNVTVTIDTNSSNTPDATYRSLSSPNNQKTVAVTNTNTDVAGFTVSKTTSEISEAGGTDTFTIVLDTKPTGDVVLDVLSTDTGEVVVTGTTSTGNAGSGTNAGRKFTFTPSGGTIWSTPQTVTITGQQDTIVDGPISKRIDISVNTTDTADTNYDSYTTTKSVAVTITDDEVPSFSLSKTASTIDEAGGTDTFTVVLTKEPTGTVVLDVISSDTGAATVSSSALTFTTGNWDTPKTITITSVNDDIDADRTATITVSVDKAQSQDLYDNVAAQTIAVTLTDDDAVGITVTQSSGSTTVSEAGTTDTFTVKLDSQPSSNVVIGLRSEDTSEVFIVGTLPGNFIDNQIQKKLTFTPSNWNNAQTVTVQGATQTDPLEGDKTINVIVSVVDAESDSTFSDVADVTVAVTMTDISPDLTVTEEGNSIPLTALTVTEAAGGSKTNTFDIVLTKQPTSDVKFNAVSSHTGVAIVKTPSDGVLTFTNGNWNTAQTITIEGLDDDTDVNRTANITISVDKPNSDSKFLLITDKTVAVTLTDNDTAGITVTESDGGTSVTEAGSTDTFTVVLDSQPATKDVILNVTSGDTGEVTVSPAKLTFTRANWNAAQTVTVTGVNDDIVDGNVDDTLVTIAVDAQSDSTFLSVANKTVTVTTTDDDIAGFTIVGTPSVSKSGSTDTYTVVLNKAPLTDVVISNTSAAAGKVTVTTDPTGGNLTFTPSNWNTPQIVTVTGVSDTSLNLSNQSVDVTVAVVDGSSDDAFDSVADQTVAVTLVENKSPIIVSANTLSVNEGSTGPFTVKLGAQPASNKNVVLNVVSDTISVATVNTPLTFTNGNWDSTQNITVTGVNNDTLGNGNAKITISVEGTGGSRDVNFDAAADKTVDVTVVNNDTAGFTLSETTQTVNEAGTTDTFNVKLNARPVSGKNVVLNVVSLDTSEVTVTTPTDGVLTFTNGNWDTDQAVVVTAVNDTKGDGTTLTNVVVSVNKDGISRDTDFDDVASQTVAVTAEDNEYDFIVSTNRIGVTQDKGSVATFNVKLTRQPSDDVVISTTSENTNRITVSPATLTFTNAVNNWSTAKTVTVTVPSDLTSGTDKIPFNITLSVVDASSDNNFDNASDKIVIATMSFRPPERRVNRDIIPTTANSSGLRLLLDNNRYSKSGSSIGRVGGTSLSSRASRRR